MISQVGSSALSFLQCFDTFGWVTGRASSPHQRCSSGSGRGRISRNQLANAGSFGC